MLRSANRFSVDPACSNTDQNSDAARNNTPITYRRLRSSGVHSLEEYIQPKNPTMTTSRKTPAPSATCRALIGTMPV